MRNVLKQLPKIGTVGAFVSASPVFPNVFWADGTGGGGGGIEVPYVAVTIPAQNLSGDVENFPFRISSKQIGGAVDGLGLDRTNLTVVTSNGDAVPTKFVADPADDTSYALYAKVTVPANAALSLAVIEGAADGAGLTGTIYNSVVDLEAGSNNNLCNDTAVTWYLGTTPTARTGTTFTTDQWVGDVPLAGAFDNDSVGEYLTAKWETSSDASANQAIMSLGDSLSASNRTTLLRRGATDHLAAWASTGSWIESAIDGDVGEVYVHSIRQSKTDRKLYTNGTETAADTGYTGTTTRQTLTIAAAKQNDSEDFVGELYQTRSANVLPSDDFILLEWRNMSGNLGEFYGFGETTPYHEVVYDFTGLTQDVNNWVAKITEREVPDYFWELANEDNLIVADQNGTEIDTHLAYFDAENQKLALYAKVPTMTAGQTNNIQVRYGIGGKDNFNTSVFSDYLVVIDTDHDVTQDVTGALTPISGATATAPTDSHFNQDYMYFDISSDATDLGQEAQITIVLNRDSGTGQGDFSALRDGSGGSEYMTFGLGAVVDLHLQSYKSSSWINGESSGQVIEASTNYCVTAYQSQLADERGTIVNGVENTEAAGATHTLYDRFTLGNAGDRTSFDFTGYIYEARLSKVVDKDRAYMDSIGLNPDNLSVTTPFD